MPASSAGRPGTPLAGQQNQYRDCRTPSPRRFRGRQGTHAAEGQRERTTGASEAPRQSMTMRTPLSSGAMGQGPRPAGHWTKYHRLAVGGLYYRRPG